MDVAGVGNIDSDDMSDAPHGPGEEICSLLSLVDWLEFEVLKYPHLNIVCFVSNHTCFFYAVTRSNGNIDDLRGYEPGDVVVLRGAAAPEQHIVVRQHSVENPDCDAGETGLQIILRPLRPRRSLGSLLGNTEIQVEVSEVCWERDYVPPDQPAPTRNAPQEWGSWFTRHDIHAEVLPERLSALGSESSLETWNHDGTGSEFESDSIPIPAPDYIEVEKTAMVHWDLEVTSSDTLAGAIIQMAATIELPDGSSESFNRMIMPPSDADWSVDAVDVHKYTRADFETGGRFDDADGIIAVWNAWQQWVDDTLTAADCVGCIVAWGGTSCEATWIHRITERRFPGVCTWPTTVELFWDPLASIKKYKTCPLNPDWLKKYHYEDQGLSLGVVYTLVTWRPDQPATQLHNAHDAAVDVRAQVEILKSKMMYPYKEVRLT